MDDDDLVLFPLMLIVQLKNRLDMTIEHVFRFNEDNLPEDVEALTDAATNHIISMLDSRSALYLVFEDRNFNKYLAPREVIETITVLAPKTVEPYVPGE